VLAYDYLEKIDKMTQRESTIQAEIEKSQSKVNGLKELMLEQSKHIKCQNDLLIQQRDELKVKDDLIEKTVRRKDKDRERLAKLMKDELPLLAETLTQNKTNVQKIQEQGEGDCKDL